MTKYGINIRKYCAKHEDYVQERALTAEGLDALLDLHDRKIRWLQHERLVHLIVTLIISILLLFSIYLYIVLDNPMVFVLLAIVLTLLCVYIRHYFFLENKVQYWYTLYDSMYQKRR